VALAFVGPRGDGDFGDRSGPVEAVGFGLHLVWVVDDGGAVAAEVGCCDGELLAVLVVFEAAHELCGGGDARVGGEAVEVGGVLEGEPSADVGKQAGADLAALVAFDADLGGGEAVEGRFDELETIDPCPRRWRPVAAGAVVDRGRAFCGQLGVARLGTVGGLLGGWRLVLISSHGSADAFRRPFGRVF
jgi:hypothetical protein